MKDYGWTISIDVKTKKKLRDDDQVGDFLDELLEFGAAVNGGRGHKGYGATFSLRRADLDAPAAFARGTRIFNEAAARAGLPKGQVVWAEIMTFAEMHRRFGS